VEETGDGDNPEIAHIVVVFVVVFEVPVLKYADKLFAYDLIFRIERMSDVGGNAVEGVQLTAGQSDMGILGNIHHFLRLGVGNNKESAAVEIGIDEADGWLVIANGSQCKLVVALEEQLHGSDSLFKTIHISVYPFGSRISIQ